MKLCIRGGRVIDPKNGIDEIQDVFIADGRIQALGRAEGFVAEQTLDASGRIVCPGLVDLQAHLREPGQTQKGSIASETAAAAAGGVTTVCCPPSTQPVLDTPAVAKLVQEKAAAAGLARMLPLGALTKDLKGEQLSNMVALRDAGCIALSNGRGPLGNNQTLLRCLQYAATYDLLVFVQPQDQVLGGQGCAHEGDLSTRLGLAGIPDTAETLDLNRYLLLAEQTGVRLHVGQLSTPHAIAMVAAARARGVQVTADIAVQNLLLTDAALQGYDSAYHLIPPLRTETHRQGLLQALAAGQVQALCSDHQPHEAAAKEAPFGATAAGMTGLQTLLPLTLAIAKQLQVGLLQGLSWVTSGPAAVLDIEAGELQAGAPADICIFDPDASWQLNAQSNVSAAANTPYMGATLQGRVDYTLLAGRLVFQR